MRVFVVSLTSRMKHFESNNDIVAIQNGSFGALWIIKNETPGSQNALLGASYDAQGVSGPPKLGLWESVWVPGAHFWWILGSLWSHLGDQK